MKIGQQKVYRTVGVFPSSSDPNKSYEVKEDQSGELSCNCRGWITKKPGQERTCRHVRDVEANRAAGQPQPPPAPARPAAPVLVGSRVQEKGGSLEDLFKSLSEKGL